MLVACMESFCAPLNVVQPHNFAAWRLCFQCAVNMPSIFVLLKQLLKKYNHKKSHACPRRTSQGLSRRLKTYQDLSRPLKTFQENSSPRLLKTSQDISRHDQNRLRFVWPLCIGVGANVPDVLLGGTEFAPETKSWVCMDII